MKVPTFDQILILFLMLLIIKALFLTCCIYIVLGPWKCQSRFKKWNSMITLHISAQFFMLKNGLATRNIFFWGISIDKLKYYFLFFNTHVQQHILARDGMMPPSQFISHWSLTAETGLTIKMLLWNRHIIYPTSHQTEIYCVVFHTLEKTLANQAVPH